MQAAENQSKILGKSDEWVLSNAEFQQLAGELLKQGLIAHYPFNGNAQDASGHSLHGTVYGATLTTDRFGNSNSAYQFDGIDDYIEIAHNELLNLTENFTISLWIKQPEANTSRGYRLVDKTTAGVNDGYNFDTYDGSTGRKLRLTGGQQNVSANTVFSLNEWHHVVVVFSKGVSTFYLDGRLDGSGKNNSEAIKTNSLTLRIGAAHGSNTEFFKGVIDDVRIYNRPLSEADIKELYVFPTALRQFVLNFDGNDYIEIKDPFANTTEFTISLWVNPAVINDGVWHGFIGKQGDQYRKPGLWLCPNENGLHYDSYDAAGKRYGELINNFFTSKDQWVHITWIKQGTEYKFYRNGELFATKTAPESFYTAKDTTYWIGRIDNFWIGQIADVRIWNRPRSQDEIKSDMSRRSLGNESGLVAYWPLNEGAGTTVADKTSGGNNGTINGATWQQQLIPIKPIQPIKKQGKIVVDADEWTLSNQGFQQAPDAAIFATNVAKWFTGGRGTGKFHAYSTNFGLTESALAQTLIKAGYTWTTGTSIQFDLPTLLNYDGIFVAGNAVDNKVLIEYVNAGGNVYLMAGTGVGGSQQEAERWNTFLNTFGLKLLGQYNGISGKQAVNSSHPIFAEVKSLYHNNGNSIVDLAPESPENQLVLTHGNGQGLIAVFEGKQVSKPAPINLPANSKIKLKSWKGDYLHRPDSPQDVTSWNTGIGNEWIVEVIGDNKIKLKSWKGDYLHRPDSPQGVTTWNTGIGNEWIVEFIGDNKIKLKSWKGDYLHRPDSAQGVTTWHTGIGNEWFLEVISSGNAEGVLVKQGPKGGSIPAKDFEFLPKNSAPKSRIKTVSMMVAWAIGTLQVEYEDVGSSPAEIYSTTSVGSGGGNKVQVSLAPGDYITKITGSWGRQAPGYPKEEIITLQFETQKGVKSQVFGGGSGKQEVEPFVFEAPAGHEIIGFFGAHGGPQDLLIRLGVYSRPVQVISTPSQPQPETPTAIAPQPQPQPQPETPTAIAPQPQPQPETPTADTETEPEPTAVATGDVFISQILYKGKIKRTQDDEYIEITNKGTTPADLSGWRVTSAGSNKQIFTFAKGTLLQPGKSFRVYSNQVHPESGGFSFGSSTALWKDSGDEGKLFDAQGNNVSTWAYGTNSIAGIKAELGVPQLVVEASPSAIVRQTALGGKVTFTEALKLALRSFLEDVNDIGSPLSLMLDNPGGYDGLPPNADKATTMKVLRSYVNQPNAKIILYSAKRGHELEGGETTETSWIFELIADQINSEQHWAIVDRAGEKAPYNYCVG